MGDQDLRDILTRVVETETGLDLATLDPDADFTTEVALDSMQFVNISVALENVLRVELPLELLKARTITQVLNVLRAAVATSAPGMQSEG